MKKRRLKWLDFFFNRRAWCIRNAVKCGKTEHYFGRAIAVPIFLLVLHEYLSYDFVGLVLSLITLGCWAIYLIAHTIEKKLYGKGLRKG